MKTPSNDVLDFINDNMKIVGDMVVWSKDNQGKTRKEGMEVGRLDKRHNNVLYKAVDVNVSKKHHSLMINRIAWYLYTGQWPERGILMLDGNTNNFSSSNLAHQNPRYINIVTRLENNLKNHKCIRQYVNTNGKTAYSVDMKILTDNGIKFKRKSFHDINTALQYKITERTKLIEHYQSIGLVHLDDYLKNLKK